MSCSVSSKAGCVGVQGSSGHVTEEEMMKLWGLQRDFRSKVMGSKRLMRAARSQLKDLLSAAR